MPKSLAFDLGPTYLGTHLSENIAVTPEGYRICRNAVVGRSGFQSYLVSELTDPDRLLGDRSPSESIEVWRDPEEVFSVATLASFEGKTFTVSHPSELLHPGTEREHHAGHIQNVRRGLEPLESGDWPILADILVTEEDAIRAIDGGERELSCGYTYRLAKEGYRFDQREIIGNHVALVPKGRAGNEARINDSLSAKEHRVKNPLKHIFGLGLAAFAKDAKPEELSEAIDAVQSQAKEKEEPKFVQIGTTRDGVAIFKLSTAVDAEPPKVEDAAGKDAADRRKRMHDALDRQMDDSEKEEQERSAEEDADMSALKDMFKPKGEDAEAHPKDCDCSECKDKAKDAAEGKVEETKDGEVTSPEPTLPASEVPASQFDAAKTFAKALRPIIAASKDKRVKKAFDTAVRALDAASKDEGSGGGSYEGFSLAARSYAGDKGFEESDLQKEANRVDEIYRNEMKARGTRGKK